MYYNTLRQILPKGIDFMIDATKLRFDTPIRLYSGESDALDRMVSYLTYAGVDAMKAYDDDDDSYALFVSDAEQNRANKLLQIYLSEEKKRLDEAQRIAEENESAPYSHVYERCEDRYQSHRSTAITFFIVGTGLLLILLLSETEVIRLPYSLAASPLSFLVIAGVGVLFEVVAIASHRHACQLKDQIADEEALTAELTNWFITTYDKRQIDTCIAAVEGDIEEEEILYLKRLERISCYLTRENEHLDPAYTAKLAEDLYALVYEN